MRNKKSEDYCSICPNRHDCALLRFSEKLREVTCVLLFTDYFVKYGPESSEPLDCSGELASTVILEYSQKETINANDVKFPVRHGKKHRWSSKRVDFNNKEIDYLLYYNLHVDPEIPSNQLS